MTPDALFRAAGEALYGPNWKSELGRLLDVDERQIRRWANGEYEPPPGVWTELAAMCRKRREDIAVIERRIRWPAHRLAKP